MRNFFLRLRHLLRNYLPHSGPRDHAAFLILPDLYRRSGFHDITLRNPFPFGLFYNGKVDTLFLRDLFCNGRRPNLSGLHKCEHVFFNDAAVGPCGSHHPQVHSVLPGHPFGRRRCLYLPTYPVFCRLGLGRYRLGTRPGSFELRICLINFSQFGKRFVLPSYYGYFLPHFHHRAFRGQDLFQYPRSGGFLLQVHFISLYFQQGFPLLDLFTLFLQPPYYGAFSHRKSQFRHPNYLGHAITPLNFLPSNYLNKSLTAFTISST
ncbi:hypothetical protein AN618_22050 [Fervidicola ferrireducens]|uniref:Uncharacterized protein n=1 Tax=Fervidicola ferrireducens TaxID=520764 RepID=A0A140L273_9FIRM|nr:hypothetical protein AN618_22050 [Fervidicola ferrireducens]